jgi:hypothetical protein
MNWSVIAGTITVLARNDGFIPSPYKVRRSSLGGSKIYARDGKRLRHLRQPTMLSNQNLMNSQLMKDTWKEVRLCQTETELALPDKALALDAEQVTALVKAALVALAAGDLAAADVVVALDILQIRIAPG